MAMLTLELPVHEKQRGFNLRRWAELLADRELARIKDRIETDRYGHIIESGTSRFIESDGVPPDSQVVGSTWRYVSKSGGPDGHLPALRARNTPDQTAAAAFLQSRTRQPNTMDAQPRQNPKMKGRA